MRPLLRLRKQRGLLLASATGGGGGGSGFSIPTPPTPSTGSTSVYAPNLTAGFTGKCPFRPWTFAVVDGVPCFANGWDQPWRWDETTGAYPLGSTAPTTFAAATQALVTNWLANGASATYYLVFAVSSLGKETAPQLTAGVAGVTVTNSAGAGRGVRVTWTDPGGEWDKARIYRRLSGTDNYKLVAEVTASTALYDDDNTDASLATATAYVYTYRTTLPPIFLALFEHGNRLWGFTGDDPTLYYAQIARTDSRFVADDFPAGNILPLEPNDGCGAIRAGWSHNAFLYAFKERGVYEVQGDDAANFQVTRMFSGRGALSMRAMVEIEDGKIAVLDPLGVYLWIPGGEPVVAGATAAGVSALAPIWARMNLGAADTFYAVHDRKNGLVYFWIALDYEPIPNYPAIYDYRRGRFLTDPPVWGTAGALVEDAAGALHRVRVDDMGLLWEDGVGNSDGVYTGSTTATLTTVTQLLWTASGASFDTTTAQGCLGSLVERYNAAGDVVDQNRVAAVAGTTITPLYWGSTTALVGDTLGVGAIPAVAEGGKMAFDSDGLKHVAGVTLEHEVEASSSFTLNFMSAADDDTLARPPNITTVVLSGNEGRTPIAVSDRGWTWRWQVSQRYAGQGFALRALSIKVKSLGTPR